MNFQQNSENYSNNNNTKQVLYHKINRRFTIQEDQKLTELVSIYGERSWPLIASKMENRNSRQCKDRWCQYLSPSANKTPWTEEEENRLVILVKELNGKWKEIAKHFDGRADAQIRNKWKTLMRRMGLLSNNENYSNKFQTFPIKSFVTYPIPINLSQNTQKEEQNQESFDNFNQVESNEDFIDFNVFDDYEDTDLFISDVQDTYV